MSTFRGATTIKIVTGIRRCGKSFLLSTLYANRLREQGVENDHIITINLEDRRNKKLRDPDALLLIRQTDTKRQRKSKVKKVRLIFEKFEDKQHIFAHKRPIIGILCVSLHPKPPNFAS